MRAPKISQNNRVLADQRRASKEVTEGLEDRIDELHVLSVRKRVCELFFFAILYSAGALLCSNGLPAFILIGIVCMGGALNSLPILLHEGLHGLLANNPRVNHLFSFLVGLPIGISATAYQETHVNHHYELGRKRDYGTYRQHLRRPSRIWFAYFVQLFFGSILYFACIPFLAFKVASSRSRVLIIAEYCVIVTACIVVFKSVPLDNLLLYWCYPILVMGMLTNIRGVASHALSDVENIYLSSRTVKSSSVVSFLFLHENYHLEHHIFPGVPSYNLAEMHALIWNRLPEAIYSQSYSQFLLGLLKAAFRNDLKPMGVVRPKYEAQTNIPPR